MGWSSKCDHDQPQDEFHGRCASSASVQAAWGCCFLNPVGGGEIFGRIMVHDFWTTCTIYIMYHQNQPNVATYTVYIYMYIYIYIYVCIHRSIWVKFPDFGGGSNLIHKVLLVSFRDFRRNCSRWWFQIFLMFTPIWGRFPFWLWWVDTSN